MPAHYFLGSRLLGSTSTPQSWDGLSPLPGSLAYFCQTCGEVWGRRLVTSPASWHVVNIHCATHSEHAWTIPGSFMLPWNHASIDELPDEVLLWEFNNLWQQHRKQGNLK